MADEKKKQPEPFMLKKPADPGAAFRRDDDEAEAPKQQEVKPGSQLGPIEVLQEAIDKQLKVTGTFVVGPAKHYRKGRLYLEGELITIVNEKPSKTWTPYDPKARAEAAAVVVPGAVNLNLGE